MIRHTVVFKLKHAVGSEAERDFLVAAARLADIPNVEKFEILRQIGKQIHFDFGLSMEFSSTTDYDAYNAHPDHVQFVRSRWLTEVVDFMEIDFQPLPGNSPTR